MLNWIQANFSKISVGLLLGVLGTAGALEVRHYMAAGDCCESGAACCHPGASCCNGRHLAHR